MRRLVEWITKPPANAIKAANWGYKEKFTKILDYHMKHLDPTAVDPEIKLLQDGEFMYYEHHATGAVENDYDKEVAVYINKTGDWVVAMYKNGTCVKTDYGNGYEELLKSIGKVLNLPAPSSAEYQELLESVGTSFAADFENYEKLWN